MCVQQNGNGDLVDSELNNPQPVDNGPTGNQACQQQQQQHTHTHTHTKACMQAHI
jgi:hypothetical protein